jgi:hypothetical protein
MNPKKLAQKIALAAAMARAIPLGVLWNFVLPTAGVDLGQPLPDFAASSDRVEFATNWYVRGDIAYGQETLPDIAPALTLSSSRSQATSLSASPLR